MEGRGRGDGKPGKTGRVLIEDLKKGQNRLKKLDFFKNHKPSREKLEKKKIPFPLSCSPEIFLSWIAPMEKNLFLPYIVQGIECLLLKPMPFMG
jgi:hypothetical protein